MQPLIVANWKLNPTTLKQAEELFEKIKSGIVGAKANVVICPPFIYLPLLKGLTLGAQNLFYEEKGAFTGEISDAMLKDLGVEYVIVGHSERRNYFGETDEVVNKKVSKALEFGLKVILCIGETGQEREAGKKNTVLQNQIRKDLQDIANTQSVIIAYEPVWAIGTGNNCSVTEANEAISFIKSCGLKNNRVLYGGSVNGKNGAEYIKYSGADGLLVGGASLNPEEFVQIIKSAS
jgi:triosephosphate isomerase